MAFFLSSVPIDLPCPLPCDEDFVKPKTKKTPEEILKEIKEKGQESRPNAAKEPPPASTEISIPEQTADTVEPLVQTYEIPGLKPGLQGEVSWTPLAGLTGTRPAVSKYSLNRYSMGEWRNYNNKISSNVSRGIAEASVIEYNARSAMLQGFGNIDKQQQENSFLLRHKAKDIFRWKVEVEQACKMITKEVKLLEVERQRIKGASRVLMLPESISRECLELRSNRAIPDLVVDVAEQELIKEMNLVNEVRATLKTTLQSIEEQLSNAKAAKQRIEYDWTDKTIAYNTESTNLTKNKKSTTIMFRPGATKYGGQTASLEYWQYFCRENIENCEAIQQKSVDFRGTINAILLNNGRKLRIQADKTDAALAECVIINTELCTRLEENLRETLEKIADMEILIKDLQVAVRKTDAAMKLAQTRLKNRNNYRPHGEAVRDVPHHALIAEVKKVHEAVTSLLNQLKNAERVNQDLLKKRIELERDIASKRKTLSIDRDRCGMIRSHYPSALELAGICQ